MLLDRPAVPAGRCKCGCGGVTPIARCSDTKRGIVRGQHLGWMHGHGGRKSPIRYLEEERGYTTPCWIWKMAKDPHGYGTIQYKNRQCKAYRVFFELKYGPVTPGLDLDHLCRVVDCVNPDHLEPVTHAENVRRGANTKLSRQQVEEIRADTTSKLRELAAKYPVGMSQISNIRRGLLWK